MAKSLRSKWKRKMRAVKRERYGKKELDRLKLMLGVKEHTGDVVMKNEADVVIVDAVTETSEKVVEIENKETKEKVEAMDDGRRVYNRKTMRDQFGQYPVWLSSSKVKNLVKKSKTLKRQKKKKVGKVIRQTKNKKR